jgi:hypothetical protein
MGILLCLVLLLNILLLLGNPYLVGRCSCSLHELSLLLEFKQLLIMLSPHKLILIYYNWLERLLLNSAQIPLRVILMRNSRCRWIWMRIQSCVRVMNICEIKPLRHNLVLRLSNMGIPSHDSFIWVSSFDLIFSSSTCNFSLLGCSVSLILF